MSHRCACPVKSTKRHVLHKQDNRPHDLRILPLLSKQLPYPPQHTVLLRVVRVILGWDLKHGGKGILELVDRISDLLGNLFPAVSQFRPLSRPRTGAQPQLAVNEEKPTC